MNQLLCIALGGAAGSVLRFLLSNGISQRIPFLFPLGTFSVNMLGCLGLGYFYGYLVDHPLVSLPVRVLISVGFFGGFTTFSTFSVESFYLLRDGNYLAAGANIFFSVVLGILFVILGFQMNGGPGK